MENWRTMTLHSFGFQVQCGGCEAWVTNVSAEDVAAAHAGKGRCHDCVVKSPHIVEVTVPAEEPVDAGAPEETVAELKAEAKEAYAAQAYPEETAAELKADPDAGPREPVGEPPKKR